MRALFDRAFAIVLDHAAPENRLSLVVDTFEFEPGIVGIDRAAGEEMADAIGANYNIDADGVAATDGGLHAIERGGNASGLNIGTRAGRNFRFCFLSHGESGCE